MVALALPKKMMRYTQGRFCVALGTKRFEVMKKLLNDRHKTGVSGPKTLKIPDTYHLVSIGVILHLKSLKCISVLVKTFL